MFLITCSTRVFRLKGLEMILTLITDSSLSLNLKVLDTTVINLLIIMQRLTLNTKTQSRERNSASTDFAMKCIKMTKLLFYELLQSLEILGSFLRTDENLHLTTENTQVTI